MIKNTKSTPTGAATKLKASAATLRGGKAADLRAINNATRGSKPPDPKSGGNAARGGKAPELTESAKPSQRGKAADPRPGDSSSRGTKAPDPKSGGNAPRHAESAAAVNSAPPIGASTPPKGAPTDSAAIVDRLPSAKAPEPKASSNATQGGKSVDPRSRDNGSRGTAPAAGTGAAPMTGASSNSAAIADPLPGGTGADRAAGTSSGGKAADTAAGVNTAPPRGASSISAAIADSSPGGTAAKPATGTDPSPAGTAADTATGTEASPAGKAADRSLGGKAAGCATGTATSPVGTATSGHPERLKFERELRAQMATVTGGLAPDVYLNAWWDWLLNLAKEPPAQLALMQEAMAKAADNFDFAVRAAAAEPLPPATGDARFGAAAWAQWPFNVYAHTYRNYSDWWQKALSSVPGVAPANERTLDFMARNALEAVSPSNYLATNPELLETTRAEAGENLVRGFGNWLEDIRGMLGAKTQNGAGQFVVGQDIAATPGKVVFRNTLIELIQYSPTTATVYAEPVLIIPAWIMKYYILDLSAKNSLVRYLVSQGHTVFILSWKNPTESDRDCGMDDYLRLGIRASADVVSHIMPDRKIHAVGYCIGGTLLSIATALFAAEGDQRVASMTLLAAQQDFSEPGELSLFISPSQIDMLEAVMSRTGVLKSEQMGGAFALLRSRDLLWTPAVNAYVRGKRDTPNDLMAWNADGTRMPYRMHSEYLRQLYLDNALARGEFAAEGRRVDLAAIHVPMFVVGTETDHVAPWKSVFKARGLTRSPDYTFLLTSGGHNAGIVSGPVHPRRRHRVRTWSNATETLSPEAWFESTAPVSGSWWPTWQHWLAQHSAASRVAPPEMGSAAAGCPVLADAPGEYVLQK